MVVQLREQDEIECLRKLLDELPFLTVKNGMFGSPSENMQRPVREAVADYLGGKTVEVYLTSNRIIGLALIYQRLPLRAGDEVLATTHDHYIHHESIRLANSRTGSSMRLPFMTILM